MSLFLSPEGAGPLPQTPPCFYSSPGWTNQGQALKIAVCVCPDVALLRSLNGRVSVGKFSCLQHVTSLIDVTKSETMNL